MGEYKNEKERKKTVIFFCSNNNENSIYTHAHTHTLISMLCMISRKKIIIHNAVCSFA